MASSPPSGRWKRSAQTAASSMSGLRGSGARARLRHQPSRRLPQRQPAAATPATSARREFIDVGLVEQPPQRRRVAAPRAPRASGFSAPRRSSWSSTCRCTVTGSPSSRHGASTLSTSTGSAVRSGRPAS